MNLVVDKKQIKGKRAIPKPKLSLKNTLRLIWVYLRSFKNWLWAELAVSFFVVAIGVGNYFAMQYAILGIENGQTSMTLLIGGILIGLFFIMWGCTYAQYIILVHVGQTVGQKIRNDVFSKVQKLPIKYFDTHNSGDLMSRFTNDINAITTAIAENMTDVIGAIFWTFGMGIVMFIMSPYLSLITIGLIPIFMSVIIVLVKKSQPIFGRQQISLGSLNGFLEEYLSGHNVIDLYSQGDLAMKKYQQYTNDIHEISYKAQLYSGLLVPWGAFMTGFISLFTTVIGIIFIVSDVGLGGVMIKLDAPASSTTRGMEFKNEKWASQFASLTIYLVLLKYFIQPFSQISNVLNIFQAAVAGANRAFDVFKVHGETNPLEKIVINIAGSNLSIDDQKRILNAKLDHYQIELQALIKKLKLYPKNVKKDDLKTIDTWILNIRSLQKIYHKNHWTLNIFKYESQMTPDLLNRINWFINQLIDINEYIDDDFKSAQAIYEHVYETLKKRKIVLDVPHLANNKDDAFKIINDLFVQVNNYLKQQLKNNKFEVTNYNVQCFDKFKNAINELEHQKIKLQYYLNSHLTYDQRDSVIQHSQVDLNQKDSLTCPDNFMDTSLAIIKVLKSIKNYYHEELNQIHQETKKPNTHEFEIQEKNKLKLKQRYDDVLADYHMTIKSLSMFDSKTINDIYANIKLDHLTFSYDGLRDVLKDINLDVKAGQTIAIVGPTGSGKSTIINLLTKFYEIEQGDIQFDSKFSIKEISKESLRRNISIVLQDTYLFNETIKENIRFGNLEATDDMIVAASKLANCDEFISNLPNGYDTVIENNGEGLSQGQRQLLAIARAILSPSSILILDEATSSIDTKTEKDIQVAMERLMNNKTTFMIAHRLSTVRNATKIVVLKDGEIIEVGNHDELLKIPDGFYARLYNSQFGDDLDIDLD